MHIYFNLVLKNREKHQHQYLQLLEVDLEYFTSESRTRINFRPCNKKIIFGSVSLHRQMIAWYQRMSLMLNMIPMYVFISITLFIR